MIGTCSECGAEDCEVTRLAAWIDPYDPEEFMMDPDALLCDGCGEDTRDSVWGVLRW